jgi:hypothetical protein
VPLVSHFISFFQSPVFGEGEVMSFFKRLLASSGFSDLILVNLLLKKRRFYRDEIIETP